MPATRARSPAEQATWLARGHSATIGLLVAVAIVLGLSLRLIAVYRVPVYEDDYASALQVAGILRTGRPTFPSGWVQWAEPVALPYVVSAIHRMAGTDIIMTGRLLSAAAGTLAIGVAFLLGRKLHTGTLGAVFSLLLAANLWSVTASTYFRHYALAEVGFLLICVLAVWWLKGRRTLAGYLAVLAGSALAAALGHYVLLPVLPAVVLLPVISKMCDVLAPRVSATPSRAETGRRKSIRLQVDVDLPLLLLLAGVGIAVAGIAWALPRYALALPQIIGRLTGEFFTILPEQRDIAFQRFFVDALFRLYGPWMMLAVAAGALTLLSQAGRSGVAILLYFGVPFTLLSTIFASLTVTSMFDRYLFPYNPALLLTVASLVVWTGERVASWLMRPASAPATSTPLLARGLAGIVSAALLVHGAFATASPAGLSGAVETWMRGRNEPRTPSYRLVTTYLKAHMRPTDLVLGTRPVDLAVELPHAQGYWIMANSGELSEAGVKREGRLLNRYSGYPAVTDLPELLDLMARADGLWVVVPYFHDSPETLSPGMWGVVHSWMNRVAAASDSTIALYRSGRQRVETLPVGPPVRAYGNIDRFTAADGITILRGRPGALNWAGVEYELPPDLAVHDAIFEVSIVLAQVRGGPSTVSFDFILEEADKDRWHTPGRLQAHVGQAYRVSLPFSYLRFWGLGGRTPQPETVTAIKVEAHNARALAFHALLQLRVIRRVRGGP